MKKLIFIVILLSTNAYANSYTDYKCQRLESKGSSIMSVTQRCENAEVVCYEKEDSIWCYKK